MYLCKYIHKYKHILDIHMHTHIYITVHICRHLTTFTDYGFASILSVEHYWAWLYNSILPHMLYLWSVSVIASPWFFCCILIVPGVSHSLHSSLTCISVTILNFSPSIDINAAWLEVPFTNIFVLQMWVTS